METSQLTQLLAEAIGSRVQHHRQQEQQQVDALLASQKHLTSNLRTLINSLDTILQLSTPRYNTAQGDLVSSCANRARTLGTKLDLVGARLARIHEHLEQQAAELGLARPAAAAPAAAAPGGGADAATTAEAAAEQENGAIPSISAEQQPGQLQVQAGSQQQQQ